MNNILSIVSNNSFCQSETRLLTANNQSKTEPLGAQSPEGQRLIQGCEEVISLSEKHTINALHNKGKSMRKISEKTGFSRNTVAKCMKPLAIVCDQKHSITSWNQAKVDQVFST
ncbi:MAG: helix-turn-helix domain-containing protein [Coriobacteriales bacterium]|nr:helix-turn-helix domain-containing protein [Coriobacteriales bacterium]